MRSFIFLYGPPGSGKSTVGRILAQQLDRPFYDVDEAIASQAGMSIAEIFARQGEADFRRQESFLLQELLVSAPGVVALGGGALLNPENRLQVEQAGKVICLTATPEVMLERLSAAQDIRPLLAGDAPSRLQELLTQRAAHYASFPWQLDTTQLSPEAAAWEIQLHLGVFHVSGMGASYPVRAGEGVMDMLGGVLKELGLRSPAFVVSDEHVAPLYATRVLSALQEAGYETRMQVIPAGEEHKTLATVTCLWQAFLEAGMERGSTVVALGGGVIGDLAGFAAAAYLRGVPWVVLPTSLLAMCDASLGGKTGVDLPQGKNLIGAFHSPRAVLADVSALATLPQEELRNGLAEVVKHGVIGDVRLFELCSQGWEAVQGNLEEIVRRSMGVKIRVIQEDPFEQGARASLNLGHTLGHALELASGFALKHGQAVAIGMVAAARLAERLGVGEAGLTDKIGACLQRLGLPTEIPSHLDAQVILRTMRYDKKRKGGKARLVFPVRIGETRWGVEVEAEQLLSLER